MSGQPLVCFVDDSAFERGLFSQVYEKMGGWRLIVADSFAAAEAALDRAGGGQLPLLWLLDLYGADPQNPQPPRLTGLAELSEQAARIPDLAGVWEGLEEFPGDRTNEYLKRLYGLVSGWHRLFIEAYQATGQSPAYGHYNLAQVRRRWPGAAALAYTRKSQPADLVEFLMAGGDGVLLKPHGPDDQAILAETKARGPRLMAFARARLKEVAAGYLLRQTLDLSGPAAGYLRGLASTLLDRGPLPAGDPPDLDDYLSRYVRTMRVWLEAGG